MGGFNKRLQKLWRRLRDNPKFSVWAPPQGSVLPNFLVVYDSRETFDGVIVAIQDALDTINESVAVYPPKEQ